MNKSILIHVRNSEMFTNFVTMLRNKKYDDNLLYSKEVKYMINEFYDNGYNVYLATIDEFDFDNNCFKRVYKVNDDEILTMTMDEVNEKIKVMIIRNIGSVEAKFDLIYKYLNYMLVNYKGFSLNNIGAMIRGMTKDYLVEIDKNELRNIGIITIPTEKFSKKVTINQINDRYSDKENYLIKPTTGELSNSLNNLSAIDEDFLRYKESKVGGWIVQPIIKDIWNGEYQLVFLNKEMIYSQKKEYINNNESIPSQKSRNIVEYYPNDKEINIMKRLIDYFEKLYNINLEICRVDFMKDKEGNPILLEFEMVNPGFFLGYLDECNDNIKKVTSKIRQYCDEKIVK